MAFSFVVETGDGDSDANSYVDLEFANDYIDTNSFATVDWDALTDDQKERLLARASKYLDRVVTWDGRRMDQDSGLRWPRSGVYDSDGFEIADDTIPQALMEAAAEMAAYLMTSDWTNLEGSRGIKEVSADVVDVKFDTSIMRGSVPFTVQAILTGLGTIRTGNRPGFKKILQA